jgi:murein DD-endopeptidase MepM/ murein hydrolase activator NlpD
MAIVAKLLPYGENIAVVLSDGSRFLALRTGTAFWKVPPNLNGLHTIKEMGSQLELVFENGDHVLAFPAVNMYYVGPNEEPYVPPPTPRFIWPFAPDPVYDPDDEFGPRPPLPFHNGKDFSGLVGASPGAPIIAMGAGTVVIAQTWNGDTDTSSLQSLGNYVRIDHGSGLMTGYAHGNSSPLVSVGQVVAQGEVLNYVGNTGFAFGAHLHLETWENGTRINPRDWMAAYALTA